MYELVIKEFTNPEILFNELQKAKILNTFISSFGTIALSNNLVTLQELASDLNMKIQVTILKQVLFPNFEQEELYNISISLNGLILNSSIITPFHKIIAVSIEPIYINFISESIYITKNIKNIYMKDFYISLKLLISNKIFWTTPKTKFFSFIKIFKINKVYNENLRELIFILRFLNNNIVISPLAQMYINSDNYIKYFISDTITNKEFLWMKKIKIINT
ncbi:MAG: hypothetical protein N2Z20_04355 [Elusimicrobiales bacterium]|nr:hypothetical protein [Elusimicrobiales bacterium]